MLFAEIPHPHIPSCDVFGLELHPFGFLVGLAIIVGTWLADRRAKQNGLNRKVIAEASLWAVVPGFIGAHLVSAIFYFPHKIADNPLYLLTFWDGISSLGGYIGGALGVTWYFYRSKHPFWPYADCIAYGFAFAWIFGRAGCTIAYDHPGILTDFALAMQYPDKGDGHPPAGLRHNLGLYEFFWAVALSAVYYWQRNKPHVSGWYLLVYIMSYMPVRFLLDFLRYHELGPGGKEEGDLRYLGLTAAQYATAALFFYGIYLILKRRRVGEVLVPDGEIHIYQDGTPAFDPDDVPEPRKRRWFWQKKKEPASTGPAASKKSRKGKKKKR